MIIHHLFVIFGFFKQSSNCSEMSCMNPLHSGDKGSTKMENLYFFQSLLHKMIYRYCKLTKHQILYSTETFKETAIDEQIIAKSGSIEIISCTFSDFTTSSIIFSDSTSDIFVTKTLFRRSNSQDGFGLFNIDCNTALLDTNCITKCRSLNGINVGAISSKNEVAFNGTSITKSSENFEEAGKSLLNIQTDKLIIFERNNISHNQVIEGYSGPSLLSQYFCIVKYCTFGYSKTGKILKIKNAELSTVNIVHNNSTRELIEAYS
ncbi:hypothetical protein TRFO_40018 [Tritrichomonas foetus]|uniref:Right handed beta helix domain-containing protein n=1 Tax=Tritrichomonas foetus TaxID=1144522 RepID=A0A1J4J900_9EUKA|nr:hypothetical protein TRFO_40018 [Tritrichomonas foetus]|eukprot:OHS93700.1 hypothetical protein TRFO_40018 [Tritrichomonas foetus]